MYSIVDDAVVAQDVAVGPQLVDQSARVSHGFLPWIRASHSSRRSPRSGLQSLEEVFIDFVERDLGLRLDTHLMTKHQLGKPRTVDQLDPGVDPVCLLASALAECAGRDEDSSITLRAHQRPDEALDRRSVNYSVFGVALGLHEDSVKAERVLADDPVDTASPEALVRSR